MPFTFQPMPHTEARDRIAKLPLVTREVMDGMLPELRAYAFCITGLDVGDQLSKVRDQIAAVPAGEKTWDKARKEIAAELDSALGGKESQRRAEILLRTHVFRGYAAARYRSLMAQVDVFPFWQYKTHGDGNVRPSHAALNRKIFPAGHEIWQRIFPPHDWGCRCLVVPLTKGAVERQMKPENDGSLLETQISQPEVFTAKEADIISKTQRLPGGISLNPSPTWSQSPWSIPGTIHHDWPLIQKRYSHDPEALDAFRQWAGKTEIPDLNMSVADWITHGAAHFSQAMRRKSRFKFDVEFSEGEEEALRALLSSKARQTFGTLAAVPPPALPHVEAFEKQVAADTVENGAVWGPDGLLRDRRRSTKRNSVRLADSALPDGIMTHNHPRGGPPSLEDVSILIEKDMGELRVATPDWIFRIQRGPRAQLQLESLPGYDRQVNAADIVARQMQPGMAWTDDEADNAVQHAMLVWLSEQGIIHYEKLPR